jgi:hypothetical protein
MPRRRAISSLSLICALLCPATVFADGGTVQFRQKTGPFWISLFTTPAPLRPGRVDLSILLESEATHQPLLDAVVHLVIAKDDRTINLDATRAQATNKLLYASQADIPSAGRWNVKVVVDRNGQQGTAAGTLLILDPLPPILVYWPYFAFVPVFILLFAIHQFLKYRENQRRRSV